MRGLSLLLISLLVFAMPAAAEPLKVNVNGVGRVLYKERYALLIGASQYSNGWDALDNVGNELVELKKELDAQGFKSTLEMDPKGRNLFEKVRSFILEHGAPENAIMIVYSGHGWTRESGPEKIGYIVPVDAPDPAVDRAGFLKLATSMQELRLLADQSEAMHTFFVFDSCFSGSIFISRSSPPSKVAHRQDVAWFETLKAKGVQFLTSGDENQRVPSVSRFMPAFIAGLQGEGGADADGDGYVSGLELGQYFRHSVAIRPQTPKFGDIGDFRRDGDFIFLPSKRKLATSATADDPNAIFNRAYALERANGTAQNEAEAAKLYRLAANAGHFGAQANLGRMYRDGRGVQQNYTEAIRWFSLAASQDDPWAQSLLGSMYADGHGVEQDNAEAVRWFRRSADQGYAAGQLNLGKRYESGRGVTQDYAEAARLYRSAAEQGEPSAQVNLGRMHEVGKGVPQDYAEAARLYRVAAEQGYPSAQVNLGLLYAKGRGVPKDEVQAVRLYRLAADRGDAAGQNNLGQMYQNGRGVPQDDAEAVRLFRLAAEQAEATGQSNLGWMYENGLAVPQDYAEAARLYELAANQGNSSAQHNLALLLLAGSGVPLDAARAVDLLRAAARQGNGDSQDRLHALGLGW